MILFKMCLERYFRGTKITHTFILYFYENLFYMFP